MKKSHFRYWELALLLAVCVTLLTGTWAQARSALLASRLVRLHVIAVSDDDTEQAVKLQVRDAVLAYLEPQLAGVTDVDTARLRIADDLDGIARAAQTAAGERPVRVSLGAEHYPTRDYGAFALPAGVYTSLRVTLGAGAGHNWWRVIYPPLCAQAAGLPELMSHTVTDEVCITDNIKRLSIDADPKVWAKEIKIMPDDLRASAFEKVRDCGWDINKCAKTLVEFYER